MVFLHSLHRPKWAASQVSFTLSTFGLSTAQWSVTTDVNVQAIPTSSTKMVILILVRLCMFPVDVFFCSVLLSNWSKSIKLIFCSVESFSQRLQQASWKVSSPFPQASGFASLVTSMCLLFVGKSAKLLLSYFQVFVLYSLWLSLQLSGYKFRLTAVGAGLQSWWPNQRSAVVGCGLWAVGW